MYVGRKIYETRESDYKDSAQISLLQHACTVYVMVFPDHF
jgi:hypothetical protein